MRKYRKLKPPAIWEHRRHDFALGRSRRNSGRGVSIPGRSRAGARPPRLEFQVASLKPNQSCKPGMLSPRVLAERYQHQSEALITVAYGITDVQSFGNLSWLETQRYDMDAKVPGPAALPEFLLSKHLNLGQAQVVRVCELHAYIPALRSRRDDGGGWIGSGGLMAAERPSPDL